MESPRLHVVSDEAHVDTSPLGAARVRRRLTVEEAAIRAGLDVADIRCLEEGRIYRFASVDDALAATLVYATALGVSEREARVLAGLPVGPAPTWSLRRGLAALAFVAACLAFALFAVRTNLGDSDPREAAQARAAANALPPPWEIRVDVYNGTPVPNAAASIANEIGGPLAYRIGTVDNARRNDYVETRVYYPPGAEAIAERLAEQLDLEMTALPSGRDQRRLVVIVGADRAG